MCQALKIHQDGLCKAEAIRKSDYIQVHKGDCSCRCARKERQKVHISGKFHN